MPDDSDRRSAPASRDRRLFLASTATALSALAAGCVGGLSDDDSDASNDTDGNASDVPPNGTDAPPDGSEDPPNGTGEPDEQPAPDASVPELIGEAAFPVDSLSFNASTEDLAPVVEAFGDVSIVGIGTSTHGTTEFYQLRHRLLRRLIENEGLRTIAIEDGVGRLRGVNEFLWSGTDAAGAMTDHMDPIHHSAPMLGFLRWLRTFNEDRDPDDRVALYGIDSQFFAYPAAAIWDYLGDVDPDYRDSLPEGYGVLADRGMRGAWRDESAFEERLADVEAMVADLRERLDGEETTYREASSDRAYELAGRYLRAIEQAREIHATRFEVGGPAWERREAHMAENTTWHAEVDGDDRIALLGHNDHVKRWNHSAGLPATGQHLADEHGDDYYPLGMAFGRGSVAAFGSESGELEGFEVADPDEGLLANTLLDVPSDRFVLDFERAREHERVAEWLANVGEMRVFGNTYYTDASPETYHVETDVGESFDGVAFVANGTAAVWEG